jgi:hypothetical protein
VWLADQAPGRCLALLEGVDAVSDRRAILVGM